MNIIPVDALPEKAPRQRKIPPKNLRLINEFVQMNVPYALIENEDETANQITNRMSASIRRFNLEDVVACVRRKGKAYLVNKSLVEK